METGTNSPEARMLALEAELRRTRSTARAALGAAALAGLGAVWALTRTEPPAAPEVAPAPAVSTDMQIHRLTLVDDAGQTRASLGLAADGAVALTLNAPDGSPRLAFQAHDQRAGLSALGPGSLNRAWLGWGWTEERGDRAELQLLDRTGHLRASLSASDATPGLVFYNDAGVATESTPP